MAGAVPTKLHVTPRCDSDLWLIAARLPTAKRDLVDSLINAHVVLWHRSPTVQETRYVHCSSVDSESQRPEKERDRGVTPRIDESEKGDQIRQFPLRIEQEQRNAPRQPALSILSGSVDTRPCSRRVGHRGSTG